MQEEEMIQNRMQAIINEFGQLKQMDRFDLTLESMGDGEIKVTLTDEKRPHDKAERIIRPDEDLSVIGDTFQYPATFSPRSKMFNVASVKDARFDKERYLIITHEDSTERFKVDSKHLREVNSLLKAKLGDKYTPLIFKEDIPIS
jgi:hypothetical protein